MKWLYQTSCLSRRWTPCEPTLQDFMIRVPAGRFFTRPLPPRFRAALPLAAAILPPLLFLAIVLPPWIEKREPGVTTREFPHVGHNLSAIGVIYLGPANLTSQEFPESIVKNPRPRQCRRHRHYRLCRSAPVDLSRPPCRGHMPQPSGTGRARRTCDGVGNDCPFRALRVAIGLSRPRRERVGNRAPRIQRAPYNQCDGTAIECDVLSRGGVR